MHHLQLALEVGQALLQLLLLDGGGGPLLVGLELDVRELLVGRGKQLLELLQLWQATLVSVECQGA